MADEAFAGELAQRLSALIGMIMEDEVDAAASSAPAGERQPLARLARLRGAGDDIAKLAAAADVVLRRYG